MIEDITCLYHIVITDVIFFYKKWSFIDFWVFLIWFGFSSISMIFVLWWSTLNEYIIREWQIYIIFQFNELKNKIFEEILSLFIYIMPK